MELGCLLGVVTGAKDRKDLQLLAEAAVGMSGIPATQKCRSGSKPVMLEASVDFIIKTSFCSVKGFNIVKNFSKFL